ncbi:CopG family transcriptional regulator [Komarekiella sp. 'clone 1']|uniref:CopG family transcriptional regulator n=1 Tax=Komarekiella delphini-convector SJRDD-AB1 TaxID=2593771 RepID=A0AA40SUJ3_9NOST|nr:CopG family transcriptional regulator [Komarekiella delphini-convector]MBD6615506.1 CopG family transcriptional regulator [Komarekiella delphini-convector SJRDD-AB1]
MNKKWVAKRLTINLTSSEAKKLENYCSITGRPATDVIRELIRTFEFHSTHSPLQPVSK